HLLPPPRAPLFPTRRSSDLRFARGDASVRSAASRHREAAEVRADPLAGQLVRFASIGVVSTIVFALLFAALAGPIGVIAADIVRDRKSTRLNSSHVAISYAV